MLFQITGAHKETGEDVILEIDAANSDEAHLIANHRGILVASCVQKKVRSATPPAVVAASSSTRNRSDESYRTGETGDHDEIPLAGHMGKPAATVAAPASDVKDCPRCGETIKAKAKVCRFCGHAFDGSIQQPAAQIVSQTEVVAPTPVDPKKLAHANATCLTFFILFVASILVSILFYAIAMAAQQTGYKDRSHVMGSVDMSVDVAQMVIGAYALMYLAGHLPVLFKVVLWKRLLGFIGGIGLSIHFIVLLIIYLIGMVQSGLF